MNADTQDCLMTYSISSDPYPLQVSTVKTSASGTIHVSVFNPLPDAMCTRITLYIPVGSSALDLSEATPTASVNTLKWVLDSNVKRIVPGSMLKHSEDMNYAKFEFSCRDIKDAKIDYDLCFTFCAPINQNIGTCEAILQEFSGESDNPDDFTTKQGTLSWIKASPVFYLENFVATQVNQTSPITEFTNGEAIRFSWESNGMYFRVYHASDTHPIYTGTDTFFTYTPGISEPSTFLMEASYQSESGQNLEAESSQQFLYSILALTVSNPDLKGRSLTVNGNAAMTGNVEVKGPATFKGAVDVQQAATFVVANVTKTLRTDNDVIMSKASIDQLIVNNAAHFISPTGEVNVSGPFVGQSSVSLCSSLSVLGNTTLKHTTVQNGLNADTVTANTAIATVAQNSSGGNIHFKDDNGHTWFCKWIDTEKDKHGNETHARIQIFWWDNYERWYGLKLNTCNYKTFVINHPLDAKRYLVHATLEGPEAAIFYRGQAQLTAGRIEIALPDYAIALAQPDSWTVHLTPINGFDQLCVEMQNGLVVNNGRFVVKSNQAESTQAFFWEAKATRNDGDPLTVEPHKDQVEVQRFGPYTFGIPK